MNIIHERSSFSNPKTNFCYHKSEKKCNNYYFSDPQLFSNFQKNLKNSDEKGFFGMSADSGIRALGNRGNIRPTQSMRSKPTSLQNAVSVAGRGFTSPLVNGDVLKSKWKRRKVSFDSREFASRLLPNFRMGICGKFHLVDENPKVRINHDCHSASFTNVLHCDSVWACPVCSQRILAFRNLEIQKACEIWSRRDKYIAKTKEGFEYLKKRPLKHRKMITLTHRHSDKDDLSDTLEKMSKATSRLCGDRIMKKFFAVIGCADEDGSNKRFVRSLEITHGQNGWHPHNHIGLFSKLTKDEMNKVKIPVVYEKKDGMAVIRWATDTRIERVKKRVKKLKEVGRELTIFDKVFKYTPLEFLQHYWKFLAVECGLGEPNLKNGVRFDDFNETDGSYLTKSGNIGLELTGENRKKGKNGSRTPWQILADGMEGCELSQALFIEYANATRGKRKIVWSNSFKELIIREIEKTENEKAKELFGLDDEIIDDEMLENLRNEIDKSNVEFVEIHQKIWGLIRRRKEMSLILNLAEKDSFGGTTLLQDYLNILFNLLDDMSKKIIELDRDRVYFKQLEKSILPPKKE